MNNGNLSAPLTAADEPSSRQTLLSPAYSPAGTLLSTSMDIGDQQSSLRNDEQYYGSRQSLLLLKSSSANGDESADRLHISPISSRASSGNSSADFGSYNVDEHLPGPDVSAEHSIARSCSSEFSDDPSGDWRPHGVNIDGDEPSPFFSRTAEEYVVCDRQLSSPSYGPSSTSVSTTELESMVGFQRYVHHHHQQHPLHQHQHQQQQHHQQQQQHHHHQQPREGLPPFCSLDNGHTVAHCVTDGVPVPLDVLLSAGYGAPHSLPFYNMSSIASASDLTTDSPPFVAPTAPFGNPLNFDPTHFHLTSSSPPTGNEFLYPLKQAYVSNSEQLLGFGRNRVNHPTATASIAMPQGGYTGFAPNTRYNGAQPSKGSKKGGRRPKEEQTHLPPEEEEKRLQRRARNKEAAARCRKRRLETMNQLEMQVAGLNDKQNDLQNEIELLKNEKRELEFILKAHEPSCRLKKSGCLTSAGRPVVTSASSSLGVDPQLGMIGGVKAEISGNCEEKMDAADVCLSAAAANRPSTLSLHNSLGIEELGVVMNTPSKIYYTDPLNTGFTPISTPSLSNFFTLANVMSAAAATLETPTVVTEASPTGVKGLAQL